MNNLMAQLIGFTQTEQFDLTLLGVGIFLLIMFIVNTIRVNRISKNYKSFMNKLGKGNNLEIMLRDYIDTVERVQKQSDEVKATCEKIDKNVMSCVQKLGIVRYNAFTDTGSDLSFAVALLDFEDNGVVFNGVYSRDNHSTTYAKPVEKGISKYTLSAEEAQAIELAKQNSRKYFMNI
jgi:hypothetical protein